MIGIAGCCSALELVDEQLLSRSVSDTWVVEMLKMHVDTLKPAYAAVKQLYG